MRSALNRVLHFASYCIPSGSLAKIIRFPLLAPFYHLVSDEEVPHVTHLLPYRAVAQFTDDMEFFLRHYSPVSLDDILAHVRTGKPLPENGFFLSFDDGLRENYDIIAPILRKKGIPATFFVTTANLDNADMGYKHKASLLADYVAKLREKHVGAVRSALARYGIQNDDPLEGLLSVNYRKREILDDIAHSLDLDFGEYLAQRRPYLTTGEIKKLISEGFTVGAHSVDHPFYPELSIDDQLRQTTESISVTAQTFELNYRVFAFPFSDRGISKRFFSQIFAKKAVEVLFASSSSFWNDEYFPFVIQRLSMENRFRSAERSLRVAELKLAIRLIAARPCVRRRE